MDQGDGAAWDCEGAPKKGFPPELIVEENVVLTRRTADASVLEALLEERNAGR